MKAMYDKINARLQALVQNCQETSLQEAMLYSVNAGGKRLRAMLLLGACEAVKGSYDEVDLDFACALELIHNYSLIHDDLPCMDNDDLRRGKPTSHKVFGEAMAILAGDALLNRAFETMANLCDSPQNIKAMRVIISASGDNGMIAGQVQDILNENKKIDSSTLSNIYSKKTGKLFVAAFMAGALLGGADEKYVAAIEQVGMKLGLAFQILDDILEVESTAEILGKSTDSDSRNQKNTYVSVHGLEAAKVDYQQISAEALTALNKLPQKTDSLCDIVLSVIKRKM